MAIEKAIKYSSVASLCSLTKPQRVKKKVENKQDLNDSTISQNAHFESTAENNKRHLLCFLHDDLKQVKN